MSCSDICDFLTAKIDEIDADTIERFRSNQINGKAFLSLCEDDLKEIGCTTGTGVFRGGGGGGAGGAQAPLSFVTKFFYFNNSN